MVQGNMDCTQLGFVSSVSQIPGSARSFTARCERCPQGRRMRVGRVRMCDEASSSAAEEPSSAAAEVELPDSLEDSMTRAKIAYEKALEDGHQRLGIEVDLSVGDETYTMLKNTLPMIQAFVSIAFGDGAGTRLIFPDAGTAARAARDWETMPNAEMDSFPRYRLSADDKVVVLVNPGASESEGLLDFVGKTSESDASIILFNPDLVDMGVTGLSLTARRLREDVIDAFETVFYLKTMPWGAVYKCYPGDWTVWQDDPDAVGGFRLLSKTSSRPSMDEMEEMLDPSEEDGSPTVTGGFFAGLKRFLSVYSRG